MSRREFWRTEARPASFDKDVPIFERKPVYADSEEDAERQVAAISAVTIGGHEHKPVLLESFSSI